MEKVELFVPGRLCILGEHSDWAGTNRMMNAELVPGMAIVTGLEQGIHAVVEKADTFIVESNLDCYCGERFECVMDTEKLRETAGNGGFFSYVAGVASYVNEHYKVGGLRVVVTAMDLPIKSGLSSSAAICVLVARAFNQLYHLQLNTMGEMNVAYMGEQRTPSRCGRLDQACAYGVHPVQMIFDGNDIRVKPIRIKRDMHWVVANLGGKKNTIKILADLNRSFPFAETDKDKLLQQALGTENEAFVTKAITLIEQGDLEALGVLLTDFQKNFDEKIRPASEKELEAPILHQLLADPFIRELTYGGKGVGSGGDGTVQFLTKGLAEQKQLIDYLDRLGKKAFPLTLKAHHEVTKVIIPLAGNATRLYPASACVHKAMMPIFHQEMLKPALLILLEQLHEAGIEEICLVVGSVEEKQIYENLLAGPQKPIYDKLSNQQKEYADLIKKIGKKISFVIQEEKRGFGHAVSLCKYFAKGEAVLLLLGDMIYQSDLKENCMEQMLQCFEKYHKGIISLHEVEESDVIHYGILHGKWKAEDAHVMDIEQITEKPSVSYARENLYMKSSGGDKKYYAVFGQYILTTEVFDELEKVVGQNPGTDTEIQLTDTLERVIRENGMVGLQVQGKSYDIGIPGKYRDTFIQY